MSCAALPNFPSFSLRAKSAVPFHSGPGFRKSINQRMPAAEGVKVHRPMWELGSFPVGFGPPSGDMQIGVALYRLCQDKRQSKSDTNEFRGDSLMNSNLLEPDFLRHSPFWAITLHWPSSHYQTGRCGNLPCKLLISTS
jgi:hypothetical protein